MFAICRLQGLVTADDGTVFDGSAGLAVFMRYTPRLLTAQEPPETLDRRRLDQAPPARFASAGGPDAPQSRQRIDAGAGLGHDPASVCDDRTRQGALLI